MEEAEEDKFYKILKKAHNKAPEKCNTFIYNNFNENVPTIGK